LLNLDGSLSQINLANSVEALTPATLSSVLAKALFFAIHVLAYYCPLYDDFMLC